MKKSIPGALTVLLFLFLKLCAAPIVWAQATGPDSPDAGTTDTTPSTGTTDAQPGESAPGPTDTPSETVPSSPDTPASEPGGVQPGADSGDNGDQTPVTAAEERGTSIFKTEIADADLDFFLRGSWNANLSLASGIRFGPEGEVVFPWGLPNMREGLVFEQVPDLTLSIWLLERYFMEVTVVQEFDQNTFLLGYQGREGEPVQSVRIGNKDVSIGSYDFIEVPEQGNASVGASAVITPGFSRHELLLRYDNTTKQEKIFVGSNEVVEEFISPEDYLHGRSFMLPDTDVTGLEVYLEDEDGDYTADDDKKYRKASVDDIEQDSAQGLLFLLNEVKGRILVYYTKGANSVGDNAPGMGMGALPGTNGGYIDPGAPAVDFNWGVTYLGENLGNRRVTINGKTCLLIWEPGTFSPFEFLNCYELPSEAPTDLWRVKIKAVPKDDELGNYRNFTYAPTFEARAGSYVFRVFINKSSLRTDFWNHYPFSDISHQLYGPQRDHNPAFFDWELYVQVVSPVDSFYLATHVVPGSVSVTRNDINETRFTMDYTSGIITFLVPINPDDRLDITYSVSQGLENNGDILFVWGNRFPFSEMLNLEIAAGVRWNILPGAFSEEVYSRTGAVLGSVSLAGKNDNFAYKAAGAVSFSNPDTTGILRLLGMEDTGLYLHITEDLAYPAARPTAAEIAGLQNRGRLFYKDYRQYDFMGSYDLKPLSWSVPSSQIFPYANDSQPGPYLVGESSEGDVDESLVLDFELDGQDDWVGFQIPVVAKQGVIDLSKLKSILYSYRAAELSSGGSANISVYIQVGDLSEDIDGDGVLDEELSKLSSGFLFNDTDNGVNLLVGGGPKQQGNDIIDSEDTDGNGFLDYPAPRQENSDSIFTTSGASVLNLTGATGWSVQNIYLSPQDQEKLKRVRSLRVVVVNNDTNPVNGKILIDAIHLEGTGFWTDNTAGEVNVREIEEQYATAKPTQQLEVAQPDVRKIFHNTGDDNKILEITWQTPTGNTFEAKTSFKQGTEGVRYRKVELYAAKMALAQALPTPPNTASNITFSLYDVNGRGIEATILHTALDNTWRKIVIDTEQKTVSIDGTQVAGATVDVDNYDSLLFFSVKADNTTSGILLVDEVHLRDPDGAIGGAFTLDTDVSLPGTLVQAGGIPLVSDLSFHEHFLAVTPGFAGLYGDPAQNMNTNSLSELSCGLLWSELSADFALQGVDTDWSVSGGHRLKIPRQPFPVVFIDRFSVRERSWGRELSRGNELLCAFPGIGSLVLDQNTLSQEHVLAQDWDANLVFILAAPYNVSAANHISTTSRGFEYPDQFYLESWVYSYRYLVPWDEGEVQDRHWDYSLIQNLDTEPVGARLEFLSGYRSYDITATSRTQINDLQLSLFLPVTVGTLTVTPGYRRTLSTTRFLGHGGSFTGDLETLADEYGIQDYFWTFIPFDELFNTDCENVFKDANRDIPNAYYKPEALLSLARPFGSNLWDLFVPSQVTVSLGKEFARQDTLYDDQTVFSLKTTTNAINLFGRFGTFALFDFFTIDQYATELELDLRYDRSGSLDTYSFNLENHMQFENELKNALVFQNLFSVEQDEELKIFDQGSITFQWYVRPENGVSLPLINEEIARTGFIGHTERIDLQFYNLLEDVSTHPVNVILTHETSFIYPDFGYIRLEASIGMDWEYIPDQIRQDNVIIAGFRLALEVNLTF